ncbi:hypothetical protein [Streptomyces sp. NPDC007205]|uniref:hypothetical protein n=1 Tax=Streptomyces sp. NPDC007205 TaxID=3154316 RepID=UPI0033FAD5CE
MNKSLCRRVGLIAFTALAATTLSMAPASANTDITIRDRDGLGSMTFHDDGDVFTVCNLQGRGGYIVGKVWYKPAIGGSWGVIASKSDSIGGGCAKITSVDVEDVGNYQMRMYWDGAGYDKEIARSRTFNE